jgi:phosphoribosylformylglycinamidine cyclo-ligase
MAHITGGGITDNLPRVLPRGTAAAVDLASWQAPPVFRWLQQAGRIPLDDMLRTFNMGIGLIVITARATADQLKQELAARGGRDARVIGEVTAGDGDPRVVYC